MPFFAIFPRLNMKHSVVFLMLPFLKFPAMAAMADVADEAYTTELFATEDITLDLKIEMRLELPKKGL